MIIWLIAAAMTAFAVGLLLLPLLRSTRPVAPRRGYDLAVYRDQLAEVERDQARGVLDADQAEAARTEIERRLLAAGESGPMPSDQSPSPAGKPTWLLAGLLAVLVPVAALGLYAVMGAPQVPSRPFAERQLPEGVPADLPQLVERLARRMEQTPDDPRGWALLGRTYMELGRYAESAQAFGQAIEHGDRSAQAWTDLGEAMTAAGEGLVGAQAQAAFAEALRQDPADPRARYYQGLGLAQSERTGEALQIWLALAADTPVEAPWRSLLEQQIANSRTALGLPADEAIPRPGPRPEDEAAPGPSAEDMATAAEMSTEERATFIRSMVARLASRLEEDPSDLDGWLRLTQAYIVLGDRDQAADALEQAAGLAGALPGDAPEHDAVARLREALAGL